MESRFEVASYLDYAAQGRLKKSFFFLFVWGFLFVFEEMTAIWSIVKELNHSEGI